MNSKSIKSIWSDFCREPISEIEGYDGMINSNDNYVLHHRLETHDRWGNKRDEPVPMWVLKRLGLYYYRPASELIFITNSEHWKLHQTGRKVSDETRAKMSALKKGYTPWNKGKTGVYTDEARKAISESVKANWRNGIYKPKPLTEETKQKLRECKIGRKHYTNGIVEIFIKGECPEGFWPGRIGWKKGD